jgi:hypothetical protein
LSPASSLRDEEVPLAHAALTQVGEHPGRAVLLQGDGTLYIGRRHEILSSSDDGRSWQRVSTLPRSTLRRAAEYSRMACRLIRHEIRALARLSDGSFVAANRQGVYHGRAGDDVFQRSETETGDLPLMPPMRLSVGPDDVVLFGEYGSGGGRAVRLYASRDRGHAFEVIHTLAEGSVLHVHNLVWDAILQHYWVLAGDHDHEPGIGILSADLRDFEWFRKGSQCYRAVEVFDFGDRLVYATDTEVEPNGLISLDKQTGQHERLRDFPGSCIYACRFGGLFAIATSVEPSPVNFTTDATLWVSRDAENWTQVYSARKDAWNGDYFQFGSIVLPSGHSGRETILYSGQAVQGIDGRAHTARLRDAEGMT